jgi:hypothetical protein
MSNITANFKDDGGSVSYDLDIVDWDDVVWEKE